MCYQQKWVGYHQLFLVMCKSYIQYLIQFGSQSSQLNTPVCRTRKLGGILKSLCLQTHSLSHNSDIIANINTVYGQVILNCDNLEITSVVSWKAHKATMSTDLFRWILSSYFPSSKNCIIYLRSTFVEMLFKIYLRLFQIDVLFNRRKETFPGKLNFIYSLHVLL